MLAYRLLKESILLMSYLFGTGVLGGPAIESKLGGGVLRGDDEDLLLGIGVDW